ncbi:MAG: DUF5668 domain-containing protein [bacterium]
MALTRSGRDNLFVGILMVLFGALFLLDNFDVAEFGDLFVDWWPLIIVALGISQAVSSRDRSCFSNYMLIIVGLVLLAVTRGWFRWRIIGDLWPLILIGMGVKFLIDATRRRE